MDNCPVVGTPAIECATRDCVASSTLVLKYSEYGFATCNEGACADAALLVKAFGTVGLDLSVKEKSDAGAFDVRLEGLSPSDWFDAITSAREGTLCAVHATLLCGYETDGDGTICSPPCQYFFCLSVICL